MDPRRVAPTRLKLTPGARERVFKLSQAEALMELTNARLAIEQPWLEEFPSEADEIDKLKLNCCDKSHLQMVGLFNFLFSLNTMALRRPCAKFSRTTDEPRNILAVDFGSQEGPGCSYSELDSGARTSTKWSWISAWRRTITLLALLWLVLITVLALNMTQLLFRQDTMLKNFKPTVMSQPEDPGAGDSVNKLRRRLWLGAYLILSNESISMAHKPPGTADPKASEYCAISHLIDNGKHFDEQQFIEWNLQLDALGYPVRSQLGVSFLCNSLIAFCPFIFYYLPLVLVLLQGNCIRLNTISHLHQPLAARRELVAQKDRIVSELIELFKASCRARMRTSADDTVLLSSVQQDTGNMGAPVFVANQWLEPSERDARLPISSLASVKQQRMYCLQCRHEHERLARRTSDHPNNREFIQILESIRTKPALVQPIVLNSGWHYTKQKAIPLLISCTLGIVFVGSLFSVALQFVLELQVRARERLRQLECRKWHSDGVVLRPQLYMQPLDEEAARHYENYNGTPTYLAYLAFVVEFGQVASINLVMGYTAVVFLVFFLSSWANFWANIFALETVDRVAWLKQIREQLRWCIESCEQFKSSNSSKKSNAYSTCQNERHQLIQRLASALVNYRLFWDQYKPFKLITNLLILQMAIFTLTSFSILYLIVAKIDTDYRFFLTCLSGSIFASFNVHLVLASLTSRLMDKVTRELVRLLARLAEQPELNLLPVVEFWRRQLLSEHELLLFASIHVFGFTVTYKKIVAFNVQILGIWMLLWRVVESATAKHWRPRNE